MKKAAFLLFLTLLIKLNGQINLLGTLPTSSTTTYGRMLTLERAGNKFYLYDYNTRTINLFNQNLSPYKQITIPALPWGSVWTEGISFLTETLFDNDSTDLDYMIISIDNPSVSPLIFHVTILNENGSYIYNDTIGAFNDAAVTSTPVIISDEFMQPYIMSGDSGTYLMLTTNSGAITKIYTLPGKMFCKKCYGNGGEPINPILTYTGNGINEESYLRLFPNPSTSNVTVQFSQLKDGGKFFAYDIHGKLVKESVLSKNQKEIIMNGEEFSNGIYQFVIISGENHIKSGKFVISK